MSDKQLNNFVKVATLELCCGDDALKVRLGRAVKTLELLLNERETWPALLRRRAQDISDVLRAESTPEDAIAAMDLPTAQHLAERILNLHADCFGISPDGEA